MASTSSSPAKILIFLERVTRPIPYHLVAMRRGVRLAFLFLCMSKNGLATGLHCDSGKKRNRPKAFIT
ncbi:hypothetical protein CHS0354_034819 [Potamilus streckersoni]|uniref:Uncharacterized protein n=1 Tax=Potamilus streckersoni TaxID=2493646 RepID=A0AAE0RT17_9BIVA|nr:hypothetical protein CHS0354_034819 [Potamilus streckersoni]